MCFSRSPLTIAVSDLEVDGRLVKRVSTYKFLSLHLTENLSWDVHIKSVIKNIIPACRAIFRTRHCLTFQMKRTLYFALIHSHLTSLSVIWGHCYNQHLSRLVTTQKRALKMIFGLDPRTPSIDLYSKLNIISVSKSIKVRSALFLLKILRGDLIVDIPISHGTDIHNYSTRHNELIRIPNIPVTKKFGVLNLLNQAIFYLNSVPSISLQDSRLSSKRKLLRDL